MHSLLYLPSTSVVCSVTRLMSRPYVTFQKLISTAALPYSSQTTSSSLPALLNTRGKHTQNTARMSSLPMPPASLLIPMAQLGTLITKKMGNINSTSMPANHALNFHLQNLYDPFNANADAIAFIESIGCRAFWNRSGALIESWMNSGSDISTQSREMAALFKDVLAFKGVSVGMRDGQAHVVGSGEQGRGLAEFAGFDAEGRCAREWSLGGVGDCFEGLVADFWG